MEIRQTLDLLEASTRPAKLETTPVSSKVIPQYTGTKMIGVGTIHKSNAVPIFSNDEAWDISKMRR